MSDWQTIPYIFAECQDSECSFRIDEPERGQRAKERAIRHARITHHKMRIEITKIYYYEDAEK